MRKRMITVSAALALMLSVAGCKDKAPEETTAATTAATSTEATTAASTTAAATTTTAVNATTEAPTAAPSKEAPTTEASTVPETTHVEPTKASTPITITAQPKDTSAVIGTPVQFSVSATGDESLSYMWQYRRDDEVAWSRSAHEGADTATLSLTATNSFDSYQFRCIISDASRQTMYSEPATLTLEIPLTAEYFPDDEFRKYVSKFNTNGDDLLDYSERLVSRFTFLPIVVGDDRVEFNVNSIAGIEYFPALEELWIQDLGLEQIDISNNRKLHVLLCDRNHFTNLDVSKNTALTYLSCNNNQLTELDISNNMNLTYLSCFDNQLSSITLPNGGVLDTAILARNPLKLLNIHAFKKTANVFIDDDVTFVHDPSVMPEGVARRYESLPTEDGWYYTTEDIYTDNYVAQGEAVYHEAKIENGFITIDGCLGSRFGYPNGPSGDIYDCGPIQLPLAENFKCKCSNVYDVESEFPIDKFNTFDTWNEDIKNWNEGWSEDPAPHSYLVKTLEIHLTNGQVDEILINVNEYP